MKKTTIQPYAIEPARSIDLTLSENPLGCSPVIVEALCRDAKFCVLKPSKYPTINGNQLKTTLAQFLNCQTSNIFIANGSEAIILNIPRALAKPGDEVLIPQLTFPLFSLYSDFAGLNVKLVQMNEDLSISLKNIKKNISKKTQLIFLCNPNNPTGMLLDRQDLIDFFNQIPESITVVVDEANIDFGGESVIDQALQRPNMLVLRTFSKGFGLAGFRVGFAVGNPLLIQELTVKTPPFPITSLSEQLAIKALSDPEFIQRSKQVMNVERKKIKQRLTEFGCQVFNSEANNIFIKLPSTIKPKQFFKELADNDVSVVKGSKFTGFDDSYFRVSPRDEKTNDLFLKVMKKIMLQSTQL